MQIRYQFFFDEQLLIQKFIGAIKVDHYLNYARTILKNSADYNIKGILIDFRDISFNEMDDDFFEQIDRVIEGRRKIQDQLVKRTDIIHVFWVDKPLPTVVADIFIGNFKELKYTYCSTSRQVIEVLKLPVHMHDLEKVVENLNLSY